MVIGVSLALGVAVLLGAATSAHSVLFASSAVLATEPVYAALFAAQVLFYAGAALGLRFRDRPRRPALLNLPYTFCLLNWATVVGLCRWLVGRQSVMWQSNNVR